MISQNFDIFPDENSIIEFFAESSQSYTTFSPITKKSIFLCFSNRSGSTLIASTLSKAGIFGKPNDFLNYEFFNSNEIISVSSSLGFKSFYEYIKFIIDNFAGSLGYFSTKASSEQLMWLARNNIIGGVFQNPLFLYSTRKNIVAQAISLDIALQTNKWTSLHQDEHIVPVYNQEKILNAIGMIRKSMATAEVFFNRCSITPLRLVYEDFQNQEEKMIEIVLYNAVYNL